jgi:hypothetical protein
MAATICGARTKVHGGVRVCTLPKGHRPPEHNKGLLEGVDVRFARSDDARPTPREVPPKEKGGK